MASLVFDVNDPTISAAITDGFNLQALKTGLGGKFNVPGNNVFNAAELGILQGTDESAKIQAVAAAWRRLAAAAAANTPPPAPPGLTALQHEQQAAQLRLAEQQRRAAEREADARRRREDAEARLRQQQADQEARQKVFQEEIDQLQKDIDALQDQLRALPFDSLNARTAIRVQLRAKESTIRQKRSDFRAHPIVSTSFFPSFFRFRSTPRTIVIPGRSRLVYDYDYSYPGQSGRVSRSKNIEFGPGEEYEGRPNWPGWPCGPGEDSTPKGCRKACYLQGEYGDLVRAKKSNRCIIPPGSARNVRSKRKITSLAKSGFFV